MIKLKIAEISRLVTSFDRFEMSEICNPNQIGFHCNAVAADGTALGSGTNSSEAIAKQIALSEMLERNFFQLVKLDANLAQRFYIEKFPTTCGFAFGFNQLATIRRATFEAAERWAWSKWIDDQLPIREVTGKVTLSDLGSFFLSHFEDARFFEQQFAVDGVRLKFGVSIGIVEGGVFAGSRVDLEDSDVWEHALIECWRHKLIFNQPDENKIVRQRIKYFGKNGQRALMQLPKSQSNSEFPQPQTLLSESLSLPECEGTIARVLFANYRGWHEGGISRFVY